MHAEARKYLWDALAAGDRVRSFLQGKRFRDYQNDELLRSAVERQLEIVGEALNQLGKKDPDIASRIHHLRRIVGFRNILAHGYATVDDAIVWGVIENHLAALLEELRQLSGE